MCVCVCLFSCIEDVSVWGLGYCSSCASVSVSVCMTLCECVFEFGGRGVLLSFYKYVCAMCIVQLWQCVC